MKNVSIVPCFRSLRASALLLATLGLAGVGAPPDLAAASPFASGTVSVDFNSRNQQGNNESGLTNMNAGPNAVITPGTWNEIDTTNGSGGFNASGSGIALNLSTGASSGASLSYSSAFGFTTQRTASATVQSNSPNFGLLGDYLAATSSASVVVTLSGLSPASTLRLDLYTASDANGRNSVFTINGVSQTAVFAAADTSYVKGHNYLEFLNLTPAADGTLTITGLNSASGESDLDGFQILVVPEPSNWALLAGGCGLFLLVRARRQPRTARA